MSLTLRMVKAQTLYPPDSAKSTTRPCFPEFRALRSTPGFMLPPAPQAEN
ncbi:MAG: hypothetical protein JNK38_00140 [Acidobacteria bacterium]|nr:hypothetical protein [Acidobacteriota bacterium]